MTCSRSEVFCDWLDVTYSPEDFPDADAVVFLLSVGAVALPGGGAYRLGEVGVVRVDSNRRCGRISASGGALAALREAGHWMGYLSLLASSPHRVTRLDVAVDTNEKGPEVVAHLRALYPQKVKLSHKPIGVRSMLAPNLAGEETGTWYAGHRSKAEVTARVYDKAWELWEKRGEMVPPRTRYEVTVRKGVGPTLRDAAEPTRLFWAYAAPALLERPPGVPDWVPGWGDGWSYVPPPVDYAAALRYRVETSEELASLVTLAERVGPGGREYLLRLLRKAITPTDELSCLT